MDARFFIGPMSKNIVDAVLQFSEENNQFIGVIPSRRQIEFNGGYVNNWSTSDFCEYIKSKSKKIILVRDHCGPSQGSVEDDGVESFIEDCKYFDVIHIDVWKKYPDYESGLKKTIQFLELCYQNNPNIFYEVGTEESIRKFESDELDKFVYDLSVNLDPKLFNRIKFLVIQSGTALKENQNIGSFDSSRLVEMVKICEKWGLIPKEHNGDYISDDTLCIKFKNGLKTINIAPEFGQIETKMILDDIGNDEVIFNDFYKLCYESGKWKKWVEDDFNPEQEKEKLINISGHYVFSNPDFHILKNKLSVDIDLKIKNSILNKLKKLHQTI
jgi:hypothetical protein